MKKFLKKHITLVPKQYATTFLSDVYFHNIKSIIRFTILLACFDLIGIVFLDLNNTSFDKYFAMLIGICFISCIIFVIIIVKKLYRVTWLHRLILHFFLLSMIVWCAHATININNQPDISAYTFGIFFLAAIVYLMPLEAMILYAIGFFIFIYLVTSYDYDSEFIFSLVFRMFFMNVIAWVFIRNRIRLKIDSYVSNQAILKHKQELEELAIRDSMTNLYNHAHSFRLLEQEIIRSKRYAHSLTVLLLDIDHFKKVNDTYGHPIGDIVITSLADILVSQCRETDIIGRYGGEEFIIIMPDTDLEASKHLCERLRQYIENFNFEGPGHLTISGGVSEHQSETALELVHMADQRLYYAKQNGRNQIAYSL